MDEIKMGGGKRNLLSTLTSGEPPSSGGFTPEGKEQATNMLGSLVQGLLSFAPGSGDYLSAKDSVYQAENALAMIKDKNYTGSGLAGIQSLLSAAGALPVVPSLGLLVSKAEKVREALLAANKAGLTHRGSDNFFSYYTPLLQVAYNAGHIGHDLSGSKSVSSYRYGKMPESGVSHNYATGRSENGLSMAVKPTGEEVGSSIWFADRPKTKYTGLKLPYTGSDGEMLILPYDVDLLD